TRRTEGETMRATALLTIGAWIGLLAASWAMASASFRTVETLLGPEARAELQSRLAPLAPDDRRAVLRHAAAEQNRWMFRTWTRAELVPAGLPRAAPGGRGGAARVLARIAAAAVIAQAAGLAPAISQLGRTLDFVPRPLPVAEGRRFGLLHTAYMLADLVKMGAVAAAAAVIARRRA